MASKGQVETVHGPHTRKAEAGGLPRLQGQPELQSEVLSKKIIPTPHNSSGRFQGGRYARIKILSSCHPVIRCVSQPPAAETDIQDKSNKRGKHLFWLMIPVGSFHRHLTQLVWSCFLRQNIRKPMAEQIYSPHGTQ